ncbi:MAG: efflux RND transporter periplasmic adaptor subunit [Moraxellaceae bacterium]|nr:efflux RND transporter periplasmic adaptor subunit [Moraxellaceae bacterium]
MRAIAFPLSLTLLATALLAGCGDKDAAAGAPPGGMPPAEVGVVTITPGRLTLTSELPGRIEALRTAEVRARVAGTIFERRFREGSDVKKGDPLFQIDPRPYQAQLDNARAELARLEALRVEKQQLATRAKTLVAKQMISQQDFESAIAAERAAEAEAAAARANADLYRMNLELANVRAPIDGRAGRALVTEGALVGQGEATPLVTIRQIDPVYVNFTQSGAELLRLRRALAAGSVQAVDGAAQVEVVLEDGSVYPHTGKLLFSDMAVDASTGSVALRASIANPDDLLLPGMFVRVRVQQAVNEAAITVPQRGLQRGPQGAFVMLVKDGKVEMQPVETGAAQGDAWIVTSGLKGGEQVIVEGLQKIGPGAPVKAVPFGAAPAASAAPAPAKP